MVADGIFNKHNKCNNKRKIVEQNIEVRRSGGPAIPVQYLRVVDGRI
jgi:hypothetical protein